MVFFIGECLLPYKGFRRMSHAAALPAPYRWLLPLAIALSGWGFSGLVGYFHQDTATAQRLTAVETHQADTSDRLNRIENKVDRLLLAVIK